jgi:basic amino acid/polyamine antiporter, APA family
VVFSYLFAAFVSVLDALCYAELASRYPLAGSVYLYTFLAFGELPALLVGTNILFDYHVGASLIARRSVVVGIAKGVALGD